MGIRSNKNINWKVVAYIIICIWLVRPFIFDIVNIDYANGNIELLNDILWIILVPISVGFISLESYKKQINKSKGILGTFVAFLFTLF